MKLSDFRKLWNKIFYKEIPVDGLAYFRIFLGMILLVTFMQDMIYANLWWSPNGLLPLKKAMSQLPTHHFSLFEILPNTDMTLNILVIIQILLLICFTIGFKSRLVTILLFITTHSFHQRNLIILNSADLLLRVYLLFMIFAPIGNKFSLDSYLAKRKGLRLPETTSAWIYRLIQIQVSVVYLSTFIAKSKGATWLDGSAVYYATRLEDLSRFYLPWVLDTYFTIRLLTWFTLIVEFSLGFLIWFKELRKPIIVFGIFFHLGIEWTMSIPTFELLMIISLIMMLEPEDLKDYIRLALNKMRKNEKSLG